MKKYKQCLLFFSAWRATVLLYVQQPVYVSSATPLKVVFSISVLSIKLMHP